MLSLFQLLHQLQLSICVQSVKVVYCHAAFISIITSTLTLNLYSNRRLPGETSTPSIYICMLETWNYVLRLSGETGTPLIFSLFLSLKFSHYHMYRWIQRRPL
jgi:hypothetical protein